MLSGPHDEKSFPAPFPIALLARRVHLWSGRHGHHTGLDRATLEPGNPVRGADAERKSICLLGGPSPLVGPPSASRL